jgi:hypothetical protein
MEDTMLKHLSICAALLALGTVPVAAQLQEAVLQRMEVPGADFDIVLAMPKSPPQRMDDLNMSADALVVHLIGGELVLAFDDADKMLKAAESLRLPVSASHWVRKDGKLRTPFAVYVVPKAE